MKDPRSGQRRAEAISSPWRAGGRILLATPYTVILLPLQTAVLALDLCFARWLPQFFIANGGGFSAFMSTSKGKYHCIGRPCSLPTIFLIWTSLSSAQFWTPRSLLSRKLPIGRYWAGCPAYSARFSWNGGALGRPINGTRSPKGLARATVSACFPREQAMTANEFCPSKVHCFL